MALFIRQTDERSKLQQQLAAELQERSKQRALANDTPPDGVNDSRYIEGTKQTTSLAWIWIAIASIIIIGIVIFTITNLYSK